MLLHTYLIGFFKLPIVFLNKRNLFGVLSLLRFQHKHLETLPYVFFVLPQTHLLFLITQSAVSQGCLWSVPMPKHPK